MDSERELRSEFRQALDVVLPPAPWLETAVRDRLNEPRREYSDRERARRGARFAFAGVLLVLLAAAIGAALILSALYAPIQVHTPPPGRGSIPIANAQFISAQDGLVLTHRGLLITHDGGSHWQLQLKLAWGGYYDVKFIDLKNIIVLLARNGRAEVLYSTSDGGLTWRTTQVADTPVSIPGWQDANGNVVTFFLSASEGWRQVNGCIPNSSCMSPGAVAIFHTIDAGTHWSEIASVDWTNPASHGLRLDVPPSPSLVFSDPEHGFMTALTTDRIATLYRTEDGGRNWEFVRLAPLPGGYQPYDKSVWPPTPRMFGSRGVIGQGSFAYVTADYGRTWSDPRPLPLGKGAVLFEDSTHWFGLDGDTLYRSSDAGATWAKTKIRLPQGLGITQLIYGDEVTLWAIAEGDLPVPGGPESSCVQGMLGPTCRFAIRSTDGGAHWTTVMLPPN